MLIVYYYSFWAYKGDREVLFFGHPFNVFKKTININNDSMDVKSSLGNFGLTMITI